MRGAVKPARHVLWEPGAATASGDPVEEDGTPTSASPRLSSTLLREEPRTTRREAVIRLNMRFVPIKSVENQGFLIRDLHQGQRPWHRSHQQAVYMNAPDRYRDPLHARGRVYMKLSTKAFCLGLPGAM